MSSPVRANRQPEQTIEAPHALPAPVTENIEKAAAKYQHYLDIGVDIRALDPKIEKLESELAHLKAHQSSLGRDQHTALTESKIYHRMAMGWCLENTWEPQPALFEEMAAVLDAQTAQRVATGNADTQVSPVTKPDPLTDDPYEVAS